MNKKLCNILLAAVLGTMALSPTSAYAGVAGNSSCVGLTKVTDGPYTWGHANTSGGGGYIPAIIFNQGEKDLIYTRTDMGGAYRWDPETNSWIGLSDWVGADNWNDLGCESLAADPIETNRVYIACGTYTNDWTSDNGSILRSVDKGDTWEKIDLPFKLGGNMPGRSMGERLTIDPVANNVLYLGTHNGNGLWRSTDYGSTWSRVESFTATGDYIDPNMGDQIGVVWEAFDPTSAPEGTNPDGTKKPCQTIYVGVADESESIYVTHDGGETWEAVEGQPTVDNQDSWVKKDEYDQFKPHGFLPVHGVLASNGELYVTYSNDCGPYDGSKGDVFKYNTKTGEWKNISPEPSSDFDNNYSGYGGLAVDGKDPNTLVVSALNSWWPDTKFWRSTDAGETWTPIWNWDGYPTRTLRYELDISKAPWLEFDGKSTYPEANPKLGWMVAGVSIDPFNSDRMMYGTGATLYGTNNLTDWGSSKKVKVEVMAQGIEETSVNLVLSTGFGDTSVVSAENDVAGFVHKKDLTATPKAMHQPVWNTDSMDFAEDKNNVMVRVGKNDFGKYPNGKSIAFSYNGGENWFEADYINGDKTMMGGTVAMNTSSEIVVWAPEGKEAYYTEDNGGTWTKCEGLPAGAVVISDRENENKFYGFVNGDFYMSEDGGKSFTKGATGLPTQDARFKAVPGQEGHIWFIGAEGMYVSKDSGMTFSKKEEIDSGRTVGFGKAKEGSDYPAIYTHAKIDGLNAFFRSDDAGETWLRINDDKHQFGSAHTDITGDPNIYGRVYIATNGLGVVYGDIKTTVEPDVLLGDINGDKVVDLADYTVFRKYLNNGGALSNIKINEANADINKDGNINFFDLVALKSLI